MNSIPESASMRVDLRSASADEISKLERALKEALDHAVLETSVIKSSRKRDSNSSTSVMASTPNFARL